MDREKELQWYREYIIREKNSRSRRVHDYVSYLKRWFDPEEDRVDGMSYEIRIKFYLPQTPNGYMFE